MAFTFRASVATAALLLFASAAYPQTETPTEEGQGTPIFRSQGWGYIVEDFSARVSTYYELRSTLEQGLPAQTITDDSEEIARKQLALARRIRAAREGARQGDIFTPAISAEFKNALMLVMDENTMAVIMEDNPGSFVPPPNGRYPRGDSFSTVPGRILAVLPRLPDDVQYRFMGRHLILLDLRANVILDRIPYAIKRRRDEK